jgi:prevent-host-death family protein
MSKTRRTASVAELKARLSEFLALVKRGEEVIVTERSVPIARLTALAEREAAAGRTQELIRTGALRPPHRRLPRDFMAGAMPEDPGGRLVEDVLAERAEGW